MSLQHEIAELCWRLDEQGATPPPLGVLLASSDPAAVHAAVLHLDRTLRAVEGARSEPTAQAWCNELPADLFALPLESQCVVAKLWVDGFAVAYPVVNPSPQLPPLVRLAWLRAAILAQPQLLDEYTGSALGWHAALELPSERVIASGLLARLAVSTDVALRRVALQTTRESIERGLLSRADAHSLVTRLAHDDNAVLACEALRLLQGAWTFALALPALQIPLDHDLELGREVLRVYAQRGGVVQLRRLLSQGVPTALLGDLLTALGHAGDANDVGLITECARRQWTLCGTAAVESLKGLKRRGCGVEAEQAQQLLASFLQGPAQCSARDVAEVLSSRADVVVGATAAPTTPAQWAAWVAVLEALGTRSAIERLQRVLSDSAERAGMGPAILALGRLGIRDAQAQITTCLDHEPEACLQALRYVGGVDSARALRERLSQDPQATWFAQAALLAFRLEPSEALLEELAQKGLLTDEILACLPEYGSTVNTRLVAEIALCPGDPRRHAAIAALGRTAGPSAIEPLAQLLREGDDTVRERASAALRTLGRRLHTQHAAYPACLEGSAEPGDACVADALVEQLRKRPLPPESIARLLDALTGLTHPALVAAVRPHLRSNLPEVRKRALACVASAGPEAAAWVLPWVTSNDVTVARQAIRALAQTRAKGVAQPVARWLDAPNMNLKKAAAEALATLGDAGVVAKLLHWLSVHDNPGFRQLLVNALQSILGAAFVGVLFDELASNPSSRNRSLLIEALSGALSASDVAALVFVRRPNTNSESWLEQLLNDIYEGKCSLRAGTLATLDAELERRGLGRLAPAPESLKDAQSASGLRAMRAGQQLARALDSRDFTQPETQALGALLACANVAGQMLTPRLSRTRVHALLSLYPQLDVAAQAGARSVLSAIELDAVARVRASRLLDPSRPHEVPAALLRHSVTNSTGDAALQLLGSTDRQVQSVAEQVLLLAPAELELRAWPKRDAALLLQHLAQQDELEASFDWACEHVELAALFRTLVQQRGAAFTVSATRRWLEQRPTLSSQWLAELCALGADADAELERLADAHSVELALRVRVLMALLQRKGTFDAEALCHRLLESEHAVLAEPAARWLWDDGTPLGRKLVLRKFIAGAFRQAFRLPLQHGDWPEFDALALSAEGDERSRAIALLQGSSESARIPRLLALWTTSDGQAREDARTALRTLSAALLLPYLRSALEAGDASVLEVVGPNPVIAAWLVELFRRSSQGPRWLAFFERTAGAGVLHAPGLCDALSECLNEPNLGASALRVLMRCDDWARPERCTALLTALAPVLAGPRRRELLPQLVTAIEPLSPQLQVQILVSIGSPTDECVSVALMDLVLTTASLKRTLPSALSAAVERQMRSELTGPPERARKILGHLAAAADTATARAELLDLLEQSLQHPSSRVRLHAHRLLRTHADRARYLEATRGLLDCADPMTLRGAIRALAFGGSIAAIPQLAELVFHGNLGVRKAASDGLIHLGHDAQPALTRALNHARPDRRSVLAALLEQISRATSNADDA